MKFSFFKSAQSKDKRPSGQLSVEQLVEHIRKGTWKEAVLKVRRREGSRAYRLLKEKLPCFTGSAVLKTRDVSTKVEDRLASHSGIIFIDIDAKDNPGLRVKDLVDKDALCQFISPGGKGIKLAYRCKSVKTAAEHRRIFDAVVDRLVAKDVKIKVDPVVKSIASLQFVSYDPEAYYNPKTKLVIQPLPPVKIKKQYVSEGNEQLKQLDEYIAALGKKDITRLYDDWLNILFALSYSFGEEGRSRMHLLCRNYAGYSEAECDEKYDACLESSQQSQNPVTVSTVFQLVTASLPVAKRKELGKKYLQTHAIGKAEETEPTNPDLAGFVRYKLWLFKKVVDRKTNEVVDLQLAKINTNELEKVLKGLGFYRYQHGPTRTYYVRIVNNIVETVDNYDVVRIVTEYVEAEGDYEFTYGDNEVTFKFSWEELALKFREIRANSTINAQIAASLTHWSPNLLEDTATESYIPYRNGIVTITAKEIKLVPYNSLPFQIWKEQILPRDFKQVKQPGMFEKFWRNVFGPPNSFAFRQSSWYYGYVLQGTKRESTARAWLLYDKQTGNNGRTGKTIISSAAGKIRSTTVIDGKRVDLTDRFAFQTVEPWTKIIVIDDVRKGTSIGPLFSMITGKVVADRKNVNPVSVRAKFILTSNYILEAEGNSESGRQFVSQVDDFYVRWGKENGNTITPVVDLHGKEFFTDWDEKDWAQFDTFSAHCLQSYLRDPAPENTIVGNSKILRFIQVNEEETYYNLCRTFVSNVYQNKGGWLIVSQSAMNEALREINEGYTGKRAGVVIRAFFSAIGANYEGLSSDRGPGGQVRTVYQISSLFDDLNWGGYEGKLGRPAGISTKKAERAVKTKKKDVK